jgi:hypothetical protein
MPTWPDGTSAATPLGSIATFTNVTKYGATGNGVTNDTAAIQAALDAVEDAGGGVVYLPEGTYVLTTGLTVARNVFVQGAGPQATSITHNGNDACFLMRDGDAFSVYPNRGVAGLSVTGNSGASAMAFDIGNSWGAYVRDAAINGYTGGRAIRLYNSAYWTEGTVLEDLMIRNNAVGIELYRNGGTESFAYQRWRHVSIQVPASGIGIDLGGSSASTVYVYNCDLDVNVWLEGNDAIAVKARAVTNVQDTRLNVTGELSGAHTGRLGIDNDGGTVVGYGRVSINTASDDVSSGVTIVRPYHEIIDRGSVSGGTTYKQITTSNIDNRHSAQFGVGVGSNIDLAYAGGYGDGGSEVFRVLSIPLDGTPATATKVLGVEPGGALAMVSGVKIHVGSGTPEGAIVSPVGSLFLRTDGGAGTTLYVKESGTGNTGWNGITG